MLLAAVPPVWAQASAPANGPVATPWVKPSAAAPITPSAGPQWRELTAAQKQILRPLAASWDTLGAGHKSKWIALAHNYPSRAPAEQEKMQSRMAEWAALKPSERERARLNFVETKKVSPSTRAAEWEAYQGLSAQEKQRLAAKASAKPTGAAIAVQPLPQDRLTPVPITRHTPALDAGAIAAKPRINPKTLLPSPPLPAPSAPAPVASVPVEAASSAASAASAPN